MRRLNPRVVPVKSLSRRGSTRLTAISRETLKAKRQLATTRGPSKEKTEGEGGSGQADLSNLYSETHKKRSRK